MKVIVLNVYQNFFIEMFNVQIYRYFGVSGAVALYYIILRGFSRILTKDKLLQTEPTASKQNGVDQ